VSRDETVQYVEDVLRAKGFERYDIDFWWLMRRPELDGRSPDTLLRIGYTRALRELADETEGTTHGQGEVQVPGQRRPDSSGSPS
jgi:hypothetical protein